MLHVARPLTANLCSHNHHRSPGYPPVCLKSSSGTSLVCAPVATCKTHQLLQLSHKTLVPRIPHQPCHISTAPTPEQQIALLRPVPSLQQGAVLLPVLSLQVSWLRQNLLQPQTSQHTHWPQTSQHTLWAQTSQLPSSSLLAHSSQRPHNHTRPRHAFPPLSCASSSETLFRSAATSASSAASRLECPAICSGGGGAYTLMRLVLKALRASTPRTSSSSSGSFTMWKSSYRS
mmetsp:Transcript_10732/g.23066  ORF Transcript_10732/g.23066 Transcript_10732/m.23066 type:complete len:232 (+) Transcript_10732:210-905(+)